VNNSKCKTCNKTFIKTAKHQVFCSLKCKSKFHNNKIKDKKNKFNKKCKFCGKEFTTTNKRKIFCSHKCGVDNNNKIRDRKKLVERLNRIKKCKFCGKEFKSAGRSIFCSNKCNLADRKKHRAAREKKIIARNKNFLLGYLEKKSCVKCGTKDIRLLDFDHIDPSTKLFNISESIYQCFPIEKIRLELTKCQTLCANCHRLKTYKERKIRKFDGYLPLDIDFEKGES
jgi:endogenous inhibitor of DNA gyrase (YacG/DUF329 family)